MRISPHPELVLTDPSMVTRLDPLPLKSLPANDSRVSTLFRELSQTKRATQAAIPADRVSELEQMLAEAQGRTATLEREAYDKAYAAGEKAGLELGRKRAEQLLKHFQEVLDRGEAELADARANFGEAVMDVAAALCEWLIGELGDELRQRLLAKAEAAALALPETSAIILAVPHEEFAQYERLVDGKRLAKSMIADANLAEGSVRIFSKQCDVLVDPRAALSEGVARLKAELLDRDYGSNA